MQQYPDYEGIIAQKDKAIRDLIFVCESVVMLSALPKTAKDEIVKYVNQAKRVL